MERESRAVMVRGMRADQSLRVSLRPGRRLDAHYRRGAAMVALAFPLTFATLLILGVAKNGLGSLSTHPLLLVSLPAGLAAMLFWVKRYSRRAVTALLNSGEAIS